jgi:porphobilinogen synthase
MADLCLDEFTDHGHCGVLERRLAVDNDATLERYASMAWPRPRPARTWSAPAA